MDAELSGARVPDDEGYRTCSACGADCPPELFDVGEGWGLRIAFTYPEYGLHTVIDPFDGRR